MKLSGKVALVTGSTRGIGREIARGFAREGATVWVHGRDKSLGHALAMEIGGHYVAADLFDPLQTSKLAQTLHCSESKLDILVNNAGLEIIMPFAEWDTQTLDRMYQVNVRAPSQLLFELLPLLRASGTASVINVTSIHERVPYPHNAAYCLSKSALAMFTKTVAIELASSGIRINNFAPGAVETDINREVIESMGRDKFAEWIPLGRVARCDEMIGPALFLASDDSSYVTGTTLYADGGYSQNLVRYRP